MKHLSVDKENYDLYMEALRTMCSKLREEYGSPLKQKGLKYSKLEDLLRHFSFSKMLRYIRNRRDIKKLMNTRVPFQRSPMKLSPPDYFSDYRIAVYTCVFGKYDDVQEPIYHPDNIDYYIITDCKVPENFGWKKFDLSPYEEKLKKLTNVEKNRWFKMHPHLFFPEYRYSVYVDGNVVPVTDFTEFINRIGDCGIAMYWHSFNNCVYQEALYNRYSVKKIDPAELEKHVDYLRSKGFPENYGMTTCNVIARDHENETCIKLMDDWWSEFMNHCRRDQISFPFVAWMNHVKMEDIAVLGHDVWKTNTLLVIQHAT